MMNRLTNRFKTLLLLILEIFDRMICHYKDSLYIQLTICQLRFPCDSHHEGHARITRSLVLSLHVHLVDRDGHRHSHLYNVHAPAKTGWR